MGEKIFMHYFFKNMFKYLSLATPIVKNLSLLDETGPWKGQILVPFKVKIKEINLIFEDISVFGI